MRLSYAVAMGVLACSTPRARSRWRSSQQRTGVRSAMPAPRTRRASRAWGVSMSYDLVVRGGTVVDGSGMPRYRADVAVEGGTIVAVGRVTGTGQQEIDAEGHVVTPGFVD